MSDGALHEIGPALRLKPTSVEAKAQASISSINRFFQCLVDLCYLPAEAVEHPPVSGWTTVQEDDLRKYGKTESVIHALRRLPYLIPKQKGHGNVQWTLLWQTLHINYVRGEMPPVWLEEVFIKVPDHTIWLTDGFEKGGYYLLLDVNTWDITEWRYPGDNTEVSRETFEAMPEEERWTVFPRMPADQYFDFLRYRFESLDFLVIQDANAWDGTGEMLMRNPQAAWDASLLAPDADDESYQPSESSSSDGSSDEDGDWEMVEDEAELKWLDEYKSKPLDSSGQYQSAEEDEREQSLENPDPAPSDAILGSSKSILCIYRPTGVQREPEAFWRGPRHVNERRRFAKIRAIYLRNGWPIDQPEITVAHIVPKPDLSRKLDLTNFDSAQCRRDLEEYISDQEKAKEMILRASHSRKVERGDYPSDSNRLQQPPTQSLMAIRYTLQRVFRAADRQPDASLLGQVDSMLSKLEDEMDRSYSREEVKRSNICKVMRVLLQRDLVLEEHGFDLRARIANIEKHMRLEED